MMNSTNKNLLNHLWEFVNKSPIISTILVSFITLIGLLLIKFYTYIYWLPYFKSYQIPLNYFQLAEFDKYSPTYRSIKYIFFTYLFFYIFLKMFKRENFYSKRSNFKIMILMIMIVIISTTMQSVIVRKLSIIDFLAIDIWDYIASAAELYFIYYLNKARYFKTKTIKLEISTIIFSLFLILIGIGVITYISGYNKEVVPARIGVFKVIDEDKAVLFETSDNYYIVPCVIKNDSIILYTTSYAFIEKNKRQVNTRYFNHVYSMNP